MQGSPAKRNFQQSPESFADPSAREVRPEQHEGRPEAAFDFVKDEKNG